MMRICPCCDGDPEFRNRTDPLRGCPVCEGFGYIDAETYNALMGYDECVDLNPYRPLTVMIVVPIEWLPFTTASVPLVLN